MLTVNTMAISKDSLEGLYLINKKNSISILLTALLLVGCSGTSDKNTVELSKIPLYELETNISQAISCEYEQFSISDNITVTIPSKIMDCDFVTKSDFSKNYKDVFLKITKSEKLNEKYLIKDDDFMGEGYVYDNEEEKKYAAISDSGFISYYEGDMYRADYNSFPIEQILIYGSDTWNSDVEFNGNKTNAEEILKMSNEWLDENWAIYEPDFSFKPYFICTINSGAEEIVAVSYNKYYNGIKLCSCDDFDIPFDSDTFDQIRNSEIKVYITKNGVQAFTSRNSSVNPVDKAEVSEVLSLTSVMKMLEKEFSGYKEYNVIGINLKYVLTYEVTMSQDGSYSYDNGVTNDARLVWEILIKPDTIVFSDGKTNFSQLQYINIDAQTGEIDYCLDTTNLKRGA